MYLNVLNINVYYEVSGDGFPIICLHNAGSDSSIWHFQTHFFKSKYQVIVIDLPGYGKSDRPKVPYTLEFYTEILEAFLNKLIIANCYILGNCIGASIALNFSKKHPNQVKAMALSNVCGGVQMMQLKSPFLFFKNKILPTFVYALLFRLNQFIWIRKKVIKRLFGKQVKQPLFNYLVELQNHSKHNQSRICMLQGLNSFDIFSTYFKYNEKHLPPNILFWGQENKVFSTDWVERIKDRIKSKEIYILQDCGHLLMYEAPETYNAHVLRLLKSLEKK